jgi:hypothetical protein
LRPWPLAQIGRLISMCLPASGPARRRFCCGSERPAGVWYQGVASAGSSLPAGQFTASQRRHRSGTAVCKPAQGMSLRGLRRSWGEGRHASAGQGIRWWHRE